MGLSFVSYLFIISQVIDVKPTDFWMKALIDLL